MQMALGLLILVASAAENRVSRHPDAVTLFHCPFDQRWDANRDQWPDRWKRKRGPGFPRYLAIGIDQDASARSGFSLKFQLDGGAASVFSPPIRVDSTFSYLLEGRIKTHGLDHDRAFLTVTFYDRQGTARETVTSTKLRDAPNWTTVRIGPVSPKEEGIQTAVIGLHLHPQARQDLRGTAWFDDIWFARLPRLVLELNNPLHLYDDPAQVRLTCRVLGIAKPHPEIVLELLDARGHRIDRETQPVAVKRISAPPAKPSGPDQRDRTAAETAYAGSILWQVPVPEFGYYRLWATLRSAGRTVQRQGVTLAICRPIERVTSGEFGWTLPAGDHPLPLDALLKLLPQVGINWVKFPLWYGSRDMARGNHVMKFAQRLERNRIKLVGLLDNPPPEVHSALPDEEPLSAAAVFTGDPAVWSPSLDPIMTRLSLRIRWWQLGGDHDRSFVGYPQLAGKIKQVRSQLFRFGQKAHLGIGWNWLSEPPPGSPPPWEFLTFSADPPLTGSELATYLAGVPRRPVQRWVLVEPLAQDQYDLATRARDLVLQMMAAKKKEADAVFLPDPFDPQHGILQADATPASLLLPWRTTALLLGGTSYLGSIRMPGGSHNNIFSRNGRAVMVVWREKPGREKIFLGHDVRQIDIWGRASKLDQSDHRQVLNTGPLPTFVVGVDVAVARWRMALALEKRQLPSVFGQPHANGIRIQNFFPQGVSGNVHIVVPKTLRSLPARMRIKAARNETQTLPFEIALPLGANTGLQNIRFDFALAASRPYRFSVYRQIQIGLGHVVIQTSTRLEQDGTLVVEQQTKNNSDRKISFRFLLFAPNRRSQHSHVVELERGQDLKTYRYPNGRALLGQTLWLRAEEIDGPRVFNHRFIAEE